MACKAAEENLRGWGRRVTVGAIGLPHASLLLREGAEARVECGVVALLPQADAHNLVHHKLQSRCDLRVLDLPCTACTSHLEISANICPKR